MTLTNQSPNIKILIVEDELQTALDLESQLINLGYTVRGQAENSAQAIKLIEEHRPDLVILDISISGQLDGLEAADHIRTTYDIPVIFLAADADQYQLVRTKEAYPFAYIVKPFQEKDLKITIEMALYLAEVDHKRRITEDALRRSEAKYKQLFTHAPSGIYEIDFDLNRIIDINDVACQYMGYTREEIVSMNPEDLLSPESREVFAQRMIQLANNEPIPEQDEFEVIGKDGQRFWLLLTVSLVKRDGRVKGVFVVAHDITERKRAEEALRQSEEKFSLAFLTSPYALTISRLSDRVFLDVNEAYTTIVGYTREETVGRSSTGLNIWANPADREEMAADLRNHGKVADREYQFRKKSGELLTGRLFAQIINLAGESCIMASINDITAQKQAEAEKERLQAQLQQAQKLEAVGALAGGIAHDFNNLLQAISGFTQIMLMSHPENTEDYSHLKSIQDASTRAANLVRQLLLFSRKVETERNPVELNQEIKQAMIILERTIPKMVDIEFRPGQNLWPIKADPVQMEQVLLNLGTNAADAMPLGGQLIIETENLLLDENASPPHIDAQPGRYVILTVTDTGQGIDPETAGHIFEPFYTTKDVGKGTGLGLASVYGIVKGHGGFISCHSEMDRGTAFKIALPAINDHVVTVMEAENPPNMKPGSETILLVDDEAPIRDMADKTLTKFGYTVITAASGEEALTIYTKRPNAIDLIIMDINMPGMGGYQSLCEIMKFDHSAQVLVASGYSVNGQSSQALEAGAAGYIGKPYNLDGLLNKIRQILDNA